MSRLWSGCACYDHLFLAPLLAKICCRFECLQFSAISPITESFMPYALLLHRPGRSQPPPRAVLQHSAKPFYAAAREVNEASGPAATCATEYKCLQFAHQNVE
nr:uncharacterized protein LOC109774205 isoform X6 [Aegilops tauschii subsp. strangulata]